MIFFNYSANPVTPQESDNSPGSSGWKKRELRPIFADMAEKQIYHGNYIQVFEQDDNGVVFEQAVFRNCVSVIPFTASGEILLIRELRPYEEPRIRLKLVTGFLEEGLSVEENANKELQEEIGKKADRLVPYLAYRQSGSINQTNTFVLAYGLSDSKLPNPDGEETILEVLPTRIDDLYTMLVEGKFTISPSAYVLLKLCIDIREGRGPAKPGGKTS